MSNIQELNDEELSQVNGGINVKDQNNKYCELKVGDIITITNYIMPGTYCLLKIETSGTHRFKEYPSVEFSKKGISFKSIPAGSTVVKIGHDQQFVDDNLIGGLVV